MIAFISASSIRSTMSFISISLFMPRDYIFSRMSSKKFSLSYCIYRARKLPFVSEQDVLAFAARMEIHPAIVVGQVQHKTKKYNWLRKYQSGVREYLMDCGIDLGWRRVNDGLRIATICHADDSHEFIVLPDVFFARLERIEELASDRTKSADALRAVIRQLRWPDAPEALRPLAIRRRDIHL